MKKYTIITRKGGQLKRKAESIGDLIIDLISHHILIDFIIDESGNKYTEIGITYKKENI